MSTITTKDGVEIFYKDWGQGQPVVFHHGWPLSCDDWDAQMLFFLQHGCSGVGKGLWGMSSLNTTDHATRVTQLEQ